MNYHTKIRDIDLYINNGGAMGITIKWDITYRCNLFCEHCVNGNYLDKKSQDINVREFECILRNITSHLEIDYIHFLGGEPLVKSDFIEITQILEKNKILFGFNTNSLLLNDNNLHKLSKNLFLKDITLSLDGADNVTNDAIRGKKVYDSVIKAIKKIQSYKNNELFSQTEIHVNFVISQKNQDSIIDMIDLCNSLSISSLNFLQYIDEGNGIGKELSISNSQYLKILEDIANKYTNSTLNLKINPSFTRPLAKDYIQKCLGMDFPSVNHLCGAGVTFAFLDNKGNIYSCDRERQYKEFTNECSLLMNSFQSIWNNRQFDIPFEKYYSLDTYQNLYPCTQCKYLREECFPCYLSLEKTGTNEMTCCSVLVREAKKKGVDLFHDQ